MTTEEFLKSLIDLYGNPLFKKGFLDFLVKAQQAGIEAAKMIWDSSPAKQILFPNISDIFEKMTEFYHSLGFVPFSRYEEALKENKRLEKERQFLKDTIKDLNQKVLTEGGKAMQELWKTSIEKHIEIGKEVAKDFMEILRQSGRK